MLISPTGVQAVHPDGEIAVVFVGYLIGVGIMLIGPRPREGRCALTVAKDTTDRRVSRPPH